MHTPTPDLEQEPDVTRRRTIALAGVAVAAAALTAPALGAHTTTRPTRTSSALTAAPAARAALEVRSVKLTVPANLDGWTPAQVDQAWAALRDILEHTQTGTGLLDPSHTVTATDLQSATDRYLSSDAQAALARIAPAATAGDTGAQQTLRPLLLWYGTTEAKAATELRLAANPYGPFTVTSAAVRPVTAAGHRALAFTVTTELTLRLLDNTGAPNQLFLVRTLNAAVVPRAGSWVIDAWAGSWQTVKPTGQALPAQPQGALGFNPTAG